jgi:hypothetical protein
MQSTTSAAGKPLRTAGPHVGITERKKTEKALAEYRDHLEELVQRRTPELEQ